MSQRWAPFAALAALLVLPRGLPAQVPASSWHDVDTGKLQPLGLQPGCWQVRTQITSTGISGHISPEQRAAIEKAPNMTAEQRAQYISALESAAQQAKQTYEKGGVSTSLFCVAIAFFDASKDIYGTPAAQCTRTIESPAPQLRARVVCPTRTSDYERIDSRNFKSTTRTVVNPQDQAAGRDVVTATTVIVGKWTGDLTPHMPYSPPITDLDGVRPKGPVAVAGLDPNRIVASVDGKQLTAYRVLGMMRSDELGDSQYPADRETILSGGTVEEDGQKLNVVTDLQWICLHYGVGNEAAQLHLNRLPPWTKRLSDLSISEGSNLYDPAIASLRDPILWDAYFKTQAKTPAERQALFEREKQKYKVTVIDPDFFYGRPSQ
jgi:hypothetical protein